MKWIYVRLLGVNAEWERETLCENEDVREGEEENIIVIIMSSLHSLSEN